MSESNDDLTTPPVDVEDIVAQRVELELKKIKGKLDTAFSERDTLKAELEALREKEVEREKERLKAENKHIELLEMEKTESSNKVAKLEEENTKLTRDIVIRQELSAYPFRNQKAANTAQRDISEDLTRGSDGEWQHKSGKSLAEAVKAYAEDPENSFLLKPKVSSGPGDGPTAPTAPSESGSLFQKTQEEVLKLASEGKLRKR